VLVSIFDRTLRFGVDAARRCCPSTSQFFGTGNNNYNAVPGSVINVNVVLYNYDIAALKVRIV
jgi:hypothetical protein